MTALSDHTVTADRTVIELAVRDRTRAYLLLHGGGGAATMTGFADLLAEQAHARVLLPTHPGFGGTTRPESLATTRDLAAAYVAMLDVLDLSDVTVVGSSFGGWVAAEIALLADDRVSGVVIVDGIGIEVAGQPMADAAGLAPEELLRLSFHDPAKAPRPPADAPVQAGPSPDVLAMAGYGGPTVSDPTLVERLGGIAVPVQVVWGESDGIVTPAYGQAYADAIPTATFTVLPETGHLAPVESPDQLLAAMLGSG